MHRGKDQHKQGISEMKERPDLSFLFEMLLKKWSSFLNQYDIVIVTYLFNQIIKSDFYSVSDTMDSIVHGSKSSVPTLRRCFDKVSTFKILYIKFDAQGKYVVRFGDKVRQEIDKKYGAIKL